MYIAQMELGRTSQNKNKTASLVCLSLSIANQPCEEIKLILRSFNRAEPVVSVFNELMDGVNFPLCVLSAWNNDSEPRGHQ